MQHAAMEDRLANAAVVILDGGLSAELNKRGFGLDSVLWTAELLQSDTAALLDVHKAYLAAGAQIIISASYQASRAGFHQLGFDANAADELIASSVAIARQAVSEFMTEHPESGPCFVAASIGPYGAVLNDGSEYRGDYGVSARVLHDFHLTRLNVLDSAGADMLACETIPSALEAAVLGQLLHDAKTPAWLSFSCKNETAICDGADIAEVCEAFADHPNVLALGINCTPPQFVTALIEKIRAAAPDKKVIVYPNSGETYVADDNNWTGDASCRDFVSMAKEWQAAGASLIGGCCRIDSEQIQAIAREFAPR